MDLSHMPDFSCANMCPYYIREKDAPVVWGVLLLVQERVRYSARSEPEAAAASAREGSVEKVLVR
jgi:hypothetical protein